MQCPPPKEKSRGPLGGPIGFRPGQLFNTAPTEVNNPFMPTTTGVLPLTLRAGNPQCTYKLNKIESVKPDADSVWFHVEKYHTSDALWYPKCLEPSLYCEMTREFLQAVIRASFEKEERQHFLLTLARIFSAPR